MFSITLKGVREGGMAITSIAGKEEELRVERVAWGNLTWVNIERPTQRETDYLAQNYPFHPLDLDDCLSRLQRAKIDEYKDEDYLFIVLHFPVFDSAAGRLGEQVAPEIEAQVDELVVLEKPSFFRAVAQVYKTWYDVPDSEVLQMMTAWRRGQDGAPASA